VLAESDERMRFVVVTLESLRTSVENEEAVDTCTRYDVAPVEAFHVNVGEVETPVANCAGEVNTGTAGTEPVPESTAVPVVKLKMVEYAPRPATFEPRTRQ
jgi:hypothetical protein